MPTKKSRKTTTPGTTRKSLESLKKYVNVLDWVIIPNTRENKSLVSPAKIEDNDMFIYFFKYTSDQTRIIKTGLIININNHKVKLKTVIDFQKIS